MGLGQCNMLIFFSITIFSGINVRSKRHYGGFSGTAAEFNLSVDGAGFLFLDLRSDDETAAK